MKKLAAILFALFAGTVCAVAMGQGVVSHTFQSPTKDAGAGVATGYYECKPLRTVSDPRLGKTLSDIESHMPANHGYAHSERITWAHETTHAINARLRNEIGYGVNCLYCLNGWAGVFREPKFSKSLVASYVPANLRGGGQEWQLYMTGSNEHFPLYILDEWVAYINGATAAQELYGNARTDSEGNIVDHDTTIALHFASYATALLLCIDANEPNYPDRAKLAEFIGWNLGRTFALTKVHPNPGYVKAYSVAYLQGGYSDCNQWTWNGRQWVAACGQQQAPPVPPSPGTLVPVHPRPVTPPTNTVVKGDRGDAGAAGAKGDKGDKGEPGTSPDVALIVKEVISNLPPQEQPQVNIEMIVAEVLKALPPIYANPDDKTGTKLGGVLPPFTAQVKDGAQLLPGDKGTRQVWLGTKLPIKRSTTGTASPAK